MRVFPFPIVLDTNVIFEGLTKRNTASGLIIDAWYADLFQVCVSEALSYEYRDVLYRKLSPAKWGKAQLALKTLLEKADYVTINYSWRPASPDPGDDSIIDCVMNANALLVTSNMRDFREAQFNLGLQVMTPVEFVVELVED